MIDLSKYPEPVRLLALCHLSGVTPRAFDMLFHHLGSLENILQSDREVFEQIDGITEDLAERASEASGRLDEAAVMYRSLREREIAVIDRFAPGYPVRWFELHDPPPLVFVRGRLPDPALKTVTLVGAGEASVEGMALTSRMAKTFAEHGVQVVSSLVGGNDMAAHLACKTAGGQSFAVLEAGFDQIGRKDLMPVAIDIANTGGVISEYMPDTEPSDLTPAESNRLMSGLGQAVVITEVYESSSRILDILVCCREIGKLVFFVIDPEHGALADESSLATAIENGAVPLAGFDKVGDIIKTLV
ncbi:MAG: DNA-processing protein DprA [candidate division Zixibacteria bacterium]|nr:DNA-processing protein DprA [candidate division Zixibacteria bacterium]